MNTTEDTGKFTMSIPLEAHQIAQSFRSRQPSKAKGKQVYLNTLAVFAVHEYLKILGIDTSLEVSDSWDPVVQSFIDTGALAIDEHHQLECRPVMPGTDSCHIPPEVWADRQGYVAVQLDESLEQATLLGFLKNVSAEDVPLNRFHRLENLFDVVEPEAISSKVTQLGQWLTTLAQEEWQKIGALLAPSQPAFAFRTDSLTQTLVDKRPGEVTHGKPLDFGLPDFRNSLALLVSIAPTESGVFNIRVRVIPFIETPQLPSELYMSIVDESGKEVMHAQTRKTEMLELRFGIDTGDRFDVCLTLQGKEIREQFVV